MIASEGLLGLLFQELVVAEAVQLVSVRREREMKNQRAGMTLQVSKLRESSRISPICH